MSYKELHIAIERLENGLYWYELRTSKDKDPYMYGRNNSSVNDILDELKQEFYEIGWK